MAPRTEATGVFLVRLRAVFRSGFRLAPDKFLAIREFHVVHGMCLLSNVPGLADQLVASQEDSVRKRGNVGGKIPELSAKPYFVGLFSRAWPCTEASLGSQDMILRTEAVGMFLMPRGTAKNLPQFACHSLSDALALNRLTHGSKVQAQISRSGSPFALFENPGSKHVEEDNLRLQICSSLRLGGLTVWHLNPNTSGGDLTWGLPRLQIEWSNGLESQSKHVEGCKSGGSTVWNLSPNRLRGDLTWGLPKLQIGWFNGLESQSKQVEGCKSGGSTVWNLSPNRLRGDLTWGLPKLQIGWFNGLESQSKQVEGCKSGGSTVWNLSPNKLRGDLTWGLPKLQIGWFNGLESQSKQVEGCKSGGSTVWNLSPNRLRGDLTWGLPKLQIGWFNGLESQSKQVEGCLTGVVVAEIVAGPHALDSCECMNIEGCHASFIEVVVALSVGSECTCIPYFRLSYLVDSPSNFLEPLNTTHGLVEPRRKNCPSIKVETGAWPSFSYGQHSTKASVWDCVWAFSGQGMLFEGSLGEKVLNIFQGFWPVA
uniref:Uncharacterized protein n=1 Tax=Fagus sylvatica TaxID=28930 RepID=A0A2N9FCD0_FAGSY